MGRKFVKRSDVLHEGYVKGLRKAYRILSEMVDGISDEEWGSLYRPLLDAIRQKDAKAVKEMLDAGADPNTKFRGRTSALFYAAHSISEILSLFLEHGADVHRAVNGDHPKDTLLHAAATSNAENCRILVELGFDVNKKDDYGTTPLHKAASYGDAETVEFLLGAGADIESHDEFGMTPLHDAVQHCNIETVKCLLANGADINATATSFGGGSCLHVACLSTYQGITKVVKLLIAAGIDLGIED